MQKPHGDLRNSDSRTPTHQVVCRIDMHAACVHTYIHTYVHACIRVYNTYIYNYIYYCMQRADMIFRLGSGMIPGDYTVQ